MVLRTVEMIRARRVANAADAHFSRHGLEFAVSAHLAGQAVQRMVREHELDDIFAQTTHFLALGVNVHARRNRRVAARHHAAGPIGLQSHLDAANTACAIRLELRRITQRRHKAATFVAVDEIEQCFAGLEAKRFAVDESGKRGEILDHG